VLLLDKLMLTAVALCQLSRERIVKVVLSSTVTVNLGRYLDIKPSPPEFWTWRLPITSLTQTDVSRWQQFRRQDVPVFPSGFSHRQSIACPYETVHPRGTSDASNGVPALQQLPVLLGSAPSSSVRGPKTRTPVGVSPVLQCDQRR